MTNLNSAQLAAVSHTKGPLLVLAGPGSGKTMVLVQRLARIIEEGHAYPSEILSVTFTNKAAGEMASRVEKLIGSRAREISIGTFHSICLKLLRKHSEKIGMSPKFLVYDDYDQTALVKECLAALNIDTGKILPNAVVDKISRAKDSCLDPKSFALKLGDNPYLRKISKVYDLYQNRLMQLEAVDFGDLIRLVVKMFDDYPELLSLYRRRWKYVMVDEYQDTNNAQYRFIEHLVKEHRNICVVGDEDQSIYRWRGADVSNILRFAEDFPGCDVVKLEQNYRSSKAIIRAAAVLINNNAGRTDKEIWTDNGDGEKVSVVSCDSERSEAEFVACKIQEVASQGKRYGDISVFYRTNAQSRPFEEAFSIKGIPYRIYGGVRFYERAEVRDVISYLKLVVDSNDDLSFLRAVSSPSRGVGKTSLEKLKSYAAFRGISLSAAIPSFVGSGAIRRSTGEKLLEFCSVIASVRDASSSMGLGELVRELLEKSGYISALASVSSVESESRLENINELLTAMEEFVPASDSDPLVEFLDRIALVSEIDRMDDDRGAVTLMTIHLAKGLEFPSVFMVGLEEGLFPHSRSLNDPNELEEERRLCYVGMTRAMNDLTISYTFKRRLFGAEKYSVASRFLGELPEDSIRRISLSSPPFCADDNDSSVSVNRSFKRRSFLPADEFDYSSDDFSGEFDQRPQEERRAPYSNGMRVRHPVFGVGVVRSCEKTSFGHKVMVSFNSGEVKRLIAEFAGLVCL
ncbi:MAG TPA: UvrD-helicase domain-containing protein [bacterium]|nr:UvrD-helicase domain-containing protein [Myxococcales bacterium]HPW45494.1 UvrD-helicase domain-containing protein [bacterium]